QPAGLAEAAPGDLLEQARRIAAAKGFGRAPEPDVPLAAFAPTSAALAAAPVRALGAQAPQPGTEEAAEDVMARIKLAALRVRSAREEPARAASAIDAEAADPREIFRRAQARVEEARRTSYRRAFGTLSPGAASSSAPAAAPEAGPSTYFIEALRLREAPGEPVRPLGALSLAGGATGAGQAHASHAKLD
ncbi:MAG: hypothetical protein JWN93_2117, partial [Hyphomicrobiales bacterium]|nr:hypothetical protein [Hyphomicrobiales bacterium]